MLTQAQLLAIAFGYVGLALTGLTAWWTLLEMSVPAHPTWANPHKQRNDAQILVCVALTVILALITYDCFVHTGAHIVSMLQAGQPHRT